jgi:Na+-translocating ferredoxin:NAD+ oxidoreductase RnfG subunit
VTFGDDSWAETEGFGSKAREDAFWQLFIGKTLPLAEGDIDTIAGATITSKAAIAAVNDAYYTLYPDEQPTPSAAPTEAPAETEAPVAAEGDRTATASSKGFAGQVGVTITVDAQNTLNAITIGDENWAETDGIGSKAKDRAFWGQFIGKALPLAEGDIDTITGATITSEAAIAAVNLAFEALGEAEAPAEEAEAPVAVEAPSEETPAPAEAALSANASKRGYNGPVYVEITVDDSGAIATLTIGNDRFAETEGLGTKVLDEAFIAQFIGKVPPLALADIDAVTGATITSEAVIAAINTAYQKLLAQQ